MDDPNAPPTAPQPATDKETPNRPLEQASPELDTDGPAPSFETQPPSFDEVLSHLLKGVSEDTRIGLQTVYESLPSDRKSIIVANLQALVRDVKPAMFYRIVRLALRQYEGVFDSERRQISIVGPVNVGKSSLYNALIVAAEPKAEVSPIPGTTRVTQAADAGLCTVIDTPGGRFSKPLVSKAL